MNRFVLRSATGRGAAALVDGCLAAGPLPAGLTLGFIYATDALAGELAAIVEELHRRLPTLAWVGTTGIGLVVGAKEYYDEPVLALLLTDLPRDHFRLLPGTEGPTDGWAEVRRWAAAAGYCFGFLHGDPGNARTPRLVAEAAALAPASFINGGLTSSNTLNYQIAQGVQSGVVSGVLFDGEVVIVTDHTQGCSPIGTPHTITAAQRNALYTLDGEPALEVMKREIGEPLAGDLRQIGGLIFVALPVKGSDTGDYLVRNLLAIDTDQGALAVGDYLDDQEQLIFCRRDEETAREDLERMLHRLSQRLAGRTIRGGVYVSCLGRGRLQFGGESQEVRLIQQRLGEFPLVGFFASGEVYNARLYGYTGVLTLFV